LKGSKRVFELFERGVKAEHIVVPVETGLLAYSISKGIQDLHEAGLSIDYQVVGVLKTVKYPR
jgi:threonine synthase